MTQRTTSLFKNIVACTLAGALVTLSPGIGSYQAFAQAVVAAAGRTVTVVPGGQAGAVRVAPVAGVNALPTLALPGTMPVLPSALPTVKPMGVAAPSVVAPAAAPALLPSAAPRAAASAVRAAVQAQVPGREAAAPQAAGAPSLKNLLSDPKAVALPAADIAAMPTGQARESGAAMMDALLGLKSRAAASAEPVAVGRALDGMRPAGSAAPNRVADRSAGKLSPALEAALRTGTRFDIRVDLVPGVSVTAEDQLVYYLSRLEAVSTNYDRDGGRMTVSGISARDIRIIAGFDAVRLLSLAGAAAPVRNGVLDTAPQGGSKALGFIKSVATMGLAGGAVYGAHFLAAAFLPSLFGMVPMAAVWAVSSGVLLLPISLYSRYRMGLRDSARLNGVKLAYDAFLGAFIGAVAVAVPVVATGALFTAPMAGMAAVAGLAFAGAAVAKETGGTGGIFNAIAAWGALSFLAPLFGSVAALPITLGGVFGLLALPAITTFAFFLGRIISAAESGRPFAVPGSMQAIRFPEYTWVLTGVVFALLTGYNAVWVNAAFAAWMFLGKTRLFNMLYAGAFAWAAFTGFSAPITFLVIAFAPERAAKFAEWALAKLLPRGEPAPSTKAEPVKLAPEGSEGRWPQFHFWLKTGLAIASLLGLGMAMTGYVFGISSFLGNLAFAGGLMGLQVYFSKKLIKAVMKAEPMDERQDPEVYGIMRELRERINADRAKKGQKPIPMPEMVNVPMPVPNAFATGASPFSAMVGVTGEMKDMTLNPERTRAALIRLMYAADANTKQFRVFRRAIRGSVPGISENAGPQEIVQALQKADRAALKALGVRALRGVMGHEFNHVMHRDMILGAVSGSIASAISFASYGVLWAVGHAQALFARIWEKLTGKGKPQGPFGPSSVGPRAKVRPEAVVEQPIRPEAFEPVTTAVAAKSLWGLVKIFAALWGPILATILSMASSRTREGHADEGGALLTEDPESLALGLGMLITWQMPGGFTLRKELLPIVASQAHVMTVNPLEQLRNAGQLPKLDAVTRALVGREDDFFFNLFITHPDTMLRIERLYDMAEALAAQKRTGAK